jgi:hypothetical protein
MMVWFPRRPSIRQEGRKLVNGEWIDSDRAPLPHGVQRELPSQRDMGHYTVTVTRIPWWDESYLEVRTTEAFKRDAPWFFLITFLTLVALAMVPR